MFRDGDETALEAVLRRAERGPGGLSTTPAIPTVVKPTGKYISPEMKTFRPHDVPTDEPKLQAPWSMLLREARQDRQTYRTTTAKDRTAAKISATKCRTLPKPFIWSLY